LVKIIWYFFVKKRRRASVWDFGKIKEEKTNEKD
jgi:hypothetical protein